MLIDLNQAVRLRTAYVGFCAACPEGSRVRAKRWAALKTGKVVATLPAAATDEEHAQTGSRSEEL
jgi:hypothetical protein